MNRLEKRALDLVRACIGDSIEIRTEVEGLPGTPDIYIPSMKLIIFIDGDFWHPRSGGRGYSMRKAAVRFLAKGEDEKALFWAKKAESNIARDKNNNRDLKKMGFKVIRLKEERLNRNWSAALSYVSSSLSRALIFKIKKGS